MFTALVILVYGLAVVLGGLAMALDDFLDFDTGIFDAGPVALWAALIYAATAALHSAAELGWVNGRTLREFLNYSYFRTEKKWVPVGRLKAWGDPLVAFAVSAFCAYKGLTESAGWFTIILGKDAADLFNHWRQWRGQVQSARGGDARKSIYPDGWVYVWSTIPMAVASLVLAVYAHIGAGVGLRPQHWLAGFVFILGNTWVLDRKRRKDAGL